ncbi:MBL fold metallo-hydrolase [Lichenihabitans sp. Uapishka_5]|uniref:MBL fold metallo-hydrolase n=1 Tax=Lichenihabitans sp. Uapishka_5 TaxID=3037302 RepID=UPI0029E81707|nr:MBL fold metallo-hydrolase [Lichenihabitans sp. Uapishka_5]MDX7953919.1 MBL fold metallo-hydrolase [Lichenihabitans sp. Uapishka_5]
MPKPPGDLLTDTPPPPAILARFWGVRGSIACPGPDTLRYGGNTPCVALRCGERQVILDAGSGLRALGLSLAAGPMPVSLDLLLSHCHVDHLIGLPFFQPAFDPGSTLRLWAGHLTPETHLARMLAQLMVPPLLPITPETFLAGMDYRDFLAGATLDLGDGITVTTTPLNHPGGATAYRVSHRGASVAYVTDHEQGPGELPDRLVAFVRDADLMIIDATFTPAEYPGRIGWGHSTWEAGVRLAERAGVGQVALFHHDPAHDDDALDALAAEAAARRPGTFAAREGQVVALAER